MTAALVADDGRLELLNCGDSRTVLIADGDGGAEGAEGAVVVELATRDHSAADPLEGERIASVGGAVECTQGSEPRVQVESPDGTWRVAVARALGGSEWRAGGVSDSAESATLRLAPRHRCLLLATDGVTGPLEDPSQGSSEGRSEPIARRAAAAAAAGMRAGEIANGLVACAAAAGGTDNASCVVLLLGEATA